eukprot:5033243-Pyramimonas_sp.AAC.1
MAKSVLGSVEAPTHNPTVTVTITVSLHLRAMHPTPSPCWTAEVRTLHHRAACSSRVPPCRT